MAEQWSTLSHTAVMPYGPHYVYPLNELAEGSEQRSLTIRPSNTYVYGWILEVRDAQLQLIASHKIHQADLSASWGDTAYLPFSHPIVHTEGDKDWFWLSITGWNENTYYFASEVFVFDLDLNKQDHTVVYTETATYIPPSSWGVNQFIGAVPIGNRLIFCSWMGKKYMTFSDLQYNDGDIDVETSSLTFPDNTDIGNVDQFRFSWGFGRVGEISEKRIAVSFHAWRPGNDPFDPLIELVFDSYGDAPDPVGILSSSSVDTYMYNNFYGSGEFGSEPSLLNSNNWVETPDYPVGGDVGDVRYIRRVEAWPWNQNTGEIVYFRGVGVLSYGYTCNWTWYVRRAATNPWAFTTSIEVGTGSTGPSNSGPSGDYASVMAAAWDLRSNRFFVMFDTHEIVGIIG